MSRRKQNAAVLKSQELVREVYAGDPYEYYPLGNTSWLPAACAADARR